MEPSIENLWFYGLRNPSPSSPPSADATAAETLEPTISNPNPICIRVSEQPISLEDESSSHTQGLHRVFDAMDANHDGELSGNELCAWMKKLGLNFAEEGLIRMINHTDIRRCGSLDLDEFVSLNKAIDAQEEREELTCTEEESKAAHMGILTEVFEVFDKDHDGLISPKELSVTLDDLGLFKKGEDSRYVDMIKRADLDGDGQVSFSEFQIMMDQQCM